MNVRRNLIANLAGQGWSAVLNLLSMPIYLHLLGVESFGLIGLSLAVLVVTSLLDGGIATTLNREMVRFTAGQASLSESRDLLRTFESTIVAIGGLAALAALALGPEFARNWLNEQSLAPATVVSCVVLMALSAIMRVIEAIYRAALLGLDRAVTMNVLAAGFTTLRVLGPVPFVLYLDGTILTYFVVQALANLASLIAFASTSHLALEGRLFGSGRFRRQLLKTHLGFAGAAFTISALTALVNQLDKLLATRLVSLVEFGYYSLAAVVATSVYQLVLPIYQSFYPKLSFLHATGQGEAFDTQMLGVFATIGFAAGVPLAFIIANAPETVFAFTGKADAMANAAPLLTILAVGTLANALFHAPLATLLALGRQYLATWTTLALFVLLVPAMLLGWNRDGLPGLATGWSAALALWLLATLAVTAWQSGRQVSLTLKAIAFAVLPFGVALALASLLRRLYVPLGTDQVHTVLAVMVSAALVGGAMIAMGWLVWRRASSPRTEEPA